MEYEGTYYLVHFSSFFIFFSTLFCALREIFAPSAFKKYPAFNLQIVI